MERSASRPCCDLPPGKRPLVPIREAAGWSSELVWTQQLEGESFVSTRDRTPVVQSAVTYYADWTTRASDKITKDTAKRLDTIRFIECDYSGTFLSLLAADGKTYNFILTLYDVLVN
jgi:hypothetical protein